MKNSFFMSFNFADFMGDSFASHRKPDADISKIMKKIHNGYARDSLNLNRDMFIAMRTEHERQEKQESKRLEAVQ